jgi:hypothetical protein
MCSGIIPVFILSVCMFFPFPHKHYEGIRDEMGITDISTVIKDYQRKWLKHLERIPQNEIQSFSISYKPKIERC